MTEHEQELIDWNKARHSPEDIKRVQAVLGLEPDGVWGIKTQTAVEQWQYDHDLKPDGKVGPKTLQAMQTPDETEPPQEWRVLTNDEVDKIIAFTVAEEGGRRNPYAALNTNNEYEGWHDTPHRDGNGRKMTPAIRAEYRTLHPDSGKPHRASKYHPSGGWYPGLTAGFIQFNQRAGALGKVVRKARDLSPDEFAVDFKGAMASDTVVEMLNAGKGSLSELRGPNTQKVLGHDLWEPFWTECFERAAGKEYFRKAQRAVAREGYFDPAIELCEEYGLSGQADLAVAFDMCVQFGVGGASKRFKRAKAAHGDAMSILDVVDEIEEEHRRDRRLRIIEKAEVFVVYEDLVLTN